MKVGCHETAGLEEDQVGFLRMDPLRHSGAVAEGPVSTLIPLYNNYTTTSIGVLQLRLMTQMCTLTKHNRCYADRNLEICVYRRLHATEV